MEKPQADKTEAECAKSDETADRNTELLRAILADSGDLIFAFKPDPDSYGGELLAANPAACQILGYSGEDLLRAGLRGIGPHAPARSSEFLSIIQRQGYCFCQTELFAQDGTRIPVEARARRLNLNGEEIIILLARDRRNCEQTAKERPGRREWFEAALSSIGEAVIATDVSGRIIFCNRIARELTGYSETEDDAKPLAAVFKLLDPATGKEDAFLLSGTDGAGFPGKTVNRLLAAKDGKKRAVSVTAAPITAGGGQTLGTVIVFQDITDQEAVAQQLRYRLRLEEAVATVGEILNSNTPVDFPRVLSILGSAVNVSRSYIFRLGEQNRLMNKTAEWCAAGVESRITETQGIRMDDYRWFSRKIIGREAVVITDVEELPPEAAAERRFYHRLKAKALLCVPMYAPAGDVTGLLGFADTKAARAWLKEDIDLLQTAAVMIGAYYDRMRSDEQIRYISYHDPLTGLFNKGFFEEEAVRLNASRQLPVSIIIGDVNGLKFVNDAFGHQKGDAILRKAADIMRASCRSEDILARWGGDEFAVLLPQTNEEAALGIVRRMQKAFAKTEMTPVKLSVALGAATKTEPAQDILAVLKKAEDHMYRNKLLSSSTRSDIITSLDKSLWERSCETEEHITVLRDLALYLGQELGLPASDLDELSLLAMLHDIGKIGIPYEVLRKTEPLTAEECALLQKHPEIGFRITSSVPELAPVSYGIMTHHENWDGSGYPNGLKGEEIPLIARIIAIIDAYDLLLRSRDNRRVKSRAEALAAIKAGAGTRFDPHLAERFIAAIDGCAAAAETAGGQEPG